MTNVEILSKILEIPGAAMGRAGKSNFVVIPTEDGYTKVAITAALSKDTKTHKAFNAEAAIAEYKAYEAEVALREAEKANKPVKVKGVNPEAPARRDEGRHRGCRRSHFRERPAPDRLCRRPGTARRGGSPSHAH